MALHCFTRSLVEVASSFDIAVWYLKVREVQFILNRSGKHSPWLFIVCRNFKPISTGHVDRFRLCPLWNLCSIWGRNQLSSVARLGVMSCMICKQQLSPFPFYNSSLVAFCIIFRVYSFTQWKKEWNKSRKSCIVLTELFGFMYVKFIHHTIISNIFLKVYSWPFGD